MTLIFLGNLASPSGCEQLEGFRLFLELKLGKDTAMTN